MKIDDNSPYYASNFRNPSLEKKDKITIDSV